MPREETPASAKKERDRRAGKKGSVKPKVKRGTMRGRGRKRP